MPDDRTAYCVTGCGRPADTSRPLAVTRDGDPISELVCRECAASPTPQMLLQIADFFDRYDDPADQPNN